MKSLRSRDLAFWLIAVIVLVALAFAASSMGSHGVPGGRSTVPVAAPAASDSQAKPQIQALLALMPSGIAAGSDPAALTAWSASVDQQAQQGESLRSGEGAASTDPLLAGFQRVRSDAASLTAQAQNRVTATSFRIQIGLDVNHLVLLASGSPAPDLPGAAANPFGQGVLTPPQPGNPTITATPTLPEKK